VKTFKQWPDLNALRIESAEGPPEPLLDHGLSLSGASVRVFFRDVKKHLIEQINRADAVIGCVAWLTDFEVLNALASRPNGAQIIVQKEDFLRPDSYWKRDLHAAYAKVKMPLENMQNIGRDDFRGHGLSYCGSFGGIGIRCVGNYNRERSPAHPRMHHKFIVLCKTTPVASERAYTPFAAWTGSFNFSQTAGRSLENAVLIENDDAAQAYYLEWQQILALSEPLDWESDWVCSGVPDRVISRRNCAHNSCLKPLPIPSR
jgi:hypothetical protein